MTREEQLLKEVRDLIQADIRNEKLQLERKLKRALQQRDEWKERAMFYRKQLLEKRGEPHTEQG